RRRKHREEKPLAIMFPGLSSVEAECEIAGLERRMLLSPEAPIVLLSRKVGETCICPSVAPGNPSLGAMLPYTPLHHLLLDEAGFPVVATSGNLTDEPICIDEQEALERLRGIADCFLVHNRPVVRHVDDSVVRLMAGREMVLRRARGFAPLPVPLKSGIEPVLAVGAHLKNTVAVGGGESVFVSQHIGDLDTAQSLDAFHRTIESLSGLYDHKPAKVACDLHPDYVSTQFAREQQLPVTPVQHHFAHVLSCMAENELDPPVLGVSWDGTGYGLDGTVWGGEFLLATGRGEFERFAALRPFRLPGGEHAIREPRRSALGLLFELGESVSGPMAMARDRFEPGQASVLCQMLKSGLNAPLTSSMGRLYDAIASLLGIRQQHQFEGQAAMELEFLAHQAETEESYPFEVVKNPNYDPGQEPGKTPRWLIDWAPLVLLLVREIANAESTSLCAAKFHNSLVEFILSIAQIAGERRVALTGGCFQNRYLTERAVTRLEHSGFRPYWHQRIPPNDGGIALGQSWAANE
ncbi:MAG: carbamoyltransferase HypF, partial [Planctomycetota bacterium]|nr:carbamoyltransferase HypF [Planctomycetota bacterium]